MEGPLAWVDPGSVVETPSGAMYVYSEVHTRQNRARWKLRWERGEVVLV